MNSVMYFFIIGFVWAFSIQMGLKFMSTEEETWDWFTITVNIMIWPYTMVTFTTTFIKAFINQE